MNACECEWRPTSQRRRKDSAVLNCVTRVRHRTSCTTPLNVSTNETKGKHYVEFGTVSVNLMLRKEGSRPVTLRNYVIAKKSTSAEDRTKPPVIGTKQSTICHKISLKHSIVMETCKMPQLTVFGVAPIAYHGFQQPIFKPPQSLQPWLFACLEDVLTLH